VFFFSFTEEEISISILKVKRLEIAAQMAYKAVQSRKTHTFKNNKSSPTTDRLRQVKKVVKGIEDVLNRQQTTGGL